MFEFEFDEFDADSSATTEDLKGKKLPYTNRFTASLGSTYQMDSGFFIGGDVSYRGDYYLIENNSQRQDSYVILNANVGYRSDNWEVCLYGRNLGDERYALSSFNGALLTAEPLTVGGTLKVSF